MKIFSILILSFALFSCSKDDLSSAEIDAIEFLNDNPLKILGVHSPGIEALKRSKNLRYKSLDVTYFFEIKANKNFRIISKIEDCNYVEEDGRIVFTVSNLHHNELNFSRIKSITKEENDFSHRNSTDIKPIFVLNIEFDEVKTTQLPTDPFLIQFHNCDYEFSMLETETVELTRRNVSITSFNEIEIDEYEMHLRVLAGL